MDILYDRYIISYHYTNPRIQLCGELGSTRLGSGKRIMVKTVALPIGSSVPTKNGCCTAKLCTAFFINRYFSIKMHYTASVAGRNVPHLNAQCF